MADLKKVDVARLTRQLHDEAQNACDGIQRTADRMVADVASAVEAAKFLAPAATDLAATADVAAITTATFSQSIDRTGLQLQLWGQTVAHFGDVSVAPGDYRVLLFLVKR